MTDSNQPSSGRELNVPFVGTYRESCQRIPGNSSILLMGFANIQKSPNSMITMEVGEWSHSDFFGKSSQISVLLFLEYHVYCVCVNTLLKVAKWVRAQVSKSRGPGFESHRRRFESWASLFTPRCLSLSGTLLVYPKRYSLGRVFTTEMAFLSTLNRTEQK